MLETEGLFWVEAADAKWDALVCTTNLMVKADGRLVMGKGIALEFKSAIKDIDLIWGKGVSRMGDKPHLLVNRFKELLGENSPYVIGLPTKYDWRKPSSMGLIVEMVRQLVWTADIFQWGNILLPRLGCGAGALKWEEVRLELAKLLDDRFTVINKKVLNVVRTETMDTLGPIYNCGS